ncbi:MAG: mechanosensitive ion channel family protein [Smithellaceae bacterium]|nr:mechanosensitive ion channel family protein [Smithellaceae bacterium]
MNFWIFVKDALPATLFIAGGFISGLIVEKIVIARLKSFARKSNWEGREIIVSAFSGVVTLWCIMAGLYGATFTVSLGPPLLNLSDNLILVVVILSVTVLSARIAVGSVTIYAKRSEGAIQSISIFSNIIKLVIYLIGILVILDSLGISITPILTALGVGGLAVALALRDTLSNLFSGLQILVSRQIRPGDLIRLDSGEEGYVTDINWRNTIIKALPNNMIIVPNQKIASANITNYDLPEKEINVKVQAAISYHQDLEKIEKITLEVADRLQNKSPYAVAGFTPVMRYQNLEACNIKFIVILQAREFAHQSALSHEFIKSLHQRFREEGIDISLPLMLSDCRGQVR